MGAEAKLVNINVLRGFLDAVNDVLFVFQFACFAGYQAEHDLLVFNKTQRFEVACAVAVVFQIEAVDVAAAEQNFGNRLVAA